MWCKSVLLSPSLLNIAERLSPFLILWISVLNAGIEMVSEVVIIGFVVFGSDACKSEAGCILGKSRGLLLYPGWVFSGEIRAKLAVATIALLMPKKIDLYILFFTR
jgi:hypothetical protein